MKQSKYISIFLQEMRANLEELSTMLVDLEQDTKDIDLLQRIMRVSHSNKGACKMMKFQQTADLCHAMEDVFDAARHHKKEIDTIAVDLCLAALDEIEGALDAIEKTGEEPKSIAVTALLRAWYTGETLDQAALEQIQSKKSATEDDSLFTRIPSIRVDTKKLDDLLNLAGEISLLQLQMQNTDANTEELVEQFGRLSSELTDKVIQSRLVPLEIVFSRFPRLIRDLAQSQGKKIKFEMTGVDNELDKTLVDHLVSPLIHILRNAVDHGIEMPEERAKQNKPEEGTIRLALYQVEGYTVITVQDDGAAIDVAHLKDVAKAKGLPEEFLQSISEENVLDLLCDPRFSSSETVTDISGRGVGMSVVRETVNALGGRLELTLNPKKFTLMLPLQLSIINGLLVKEQGTTYTLPFIHIDRLLRIQKRHCQSQLGTLAATIDETDVPLVSLGQALGVGSKHEATQQEVFDVVLTQTQHGQVGLVVDTIVGSRDVLVKPAPEVVENIQLYSGSTILDTGLVSMIVDIPQLLQSVQNNLSSPPNHG